MGRLARSGALVSLMLASGAAAQAPSVAPAAPVAGITAGTSNSPIDITSDGTDIFQPQRLIIFKGNVEAVQNQSDGTPTRIRTPELRVYYKPKGPATPGAKPAPATGNPADQSNSIDHIEAAGPVYYVTPSENARGDHGSYEATPNTITLTGNVVVVQGKSVGKGDRLVINRNTGESNLFSNNPRAPTERVRVILYPNQQPSTAHAAPAAAAKTS